MSLGLLLLLIGLRKRVNYSVNCIGSLLIENRSKLALRVIGSVIALSSFSRLI